MCVCIVCSISCMSYIICLYFPSSDSRFESRGCILILALFFWVVGLLLLSFKNNSIIFLSVEEFIYSKIRKGDMNGHINETAPPLVPIGEVKLVQVEIVVWFVRTCEVSILFVFFVLSFFSFTLYLSMPLRESRVANRVM